MPTLGRALLVLEGEGEDGLAILDCVLASGLVVEGFLDLVEGGGGGELGCNDRWSIHRSIMNGSVLTKDITQSTGISVVGAAYRSGQA